MKRKNVLLNGMAIVLLLVASIACFLFFQDETEDHGEGSVEADFRCAENLVELGNALKRFADAHQGMLPDSLERLTELGYPVDSETCRCPARHLHYIYLGDRLSARRISPDTPIVFDRLPQPSRASECAVRGFPGRPDRRGGKEELLLPVSPEQHDSFRTGAAGKTSAPAGQNRVSTIRPAVQPENAQEV